jgi:hypothetical protein
MLSSDFVSFHRLMPVLQAVMSSDYSPDTFLHVGDSLPGYNNPEILCKIYLALRRQNQGKY